MGSVWSDPGGAAKIEVPFPIPPRKKGEEIIENVENEKENAQNLTSILT